MLRFVVVAVLIHVLFLLSIFYIYFQSPILHDLPIGTDHGNAPADRVVVFIADGLRAESFLQHGANRTTYLQEVIVSKGAFGISNTRVPTESRPGHVALFAGLYEDPSAIFKGWKENPVEFDSVFNRSQATYSWGSPDILSIFSNKMDPGKIFADSYSAEVEQFSTTSNTSVLDLWVFDKVKLFLENAENVKAISSKKKVILFLHLLGMDTSGHVHKPYSSLFTENLIVVDRGIKQIVQLIDRVTNNDQKTAYVFTSDHGMTDKGSHGSGHPVETETPFVAWGAGVQHWKDTWVENSVKNAIIDGVIVPRWDMNQADVAPLISALLGMAVPKNSCGKLPRQYLNATDIYVVDFMRTNAEQLYQQYYRYRHQSSAKVFQWNVSQKESDYVKMISKLKNDIELVYRAKNYNQVITLCDVLMDLTLEAIEFYQTYYKHELLFTLTIAMAGWMLIVLGKIFVFEEALSRINWKLICGGVFVAAVIIGYNILQNTPKTVTFYFVLPVFLWVPVLSSLKAYLKVVNINVIWQSVIFIGCAEMCVLAFFQRSVLSLFLVGNTLYLVYHLKRRPGSSSVFLLMSTNIALAIFPILPVVEKDSNHPWLLVSGVLLWCIANVFVLMKSTENNIYRNMQSVICLVLTVNLLISIYMIEHGISMCWLNYVSSWICFVLSFIMPFFTSTSIAIRLTAIVVSYAAPYIMLSLSYEPLFLFAFSTSMFSWLQAENDIACSNQKISKLFFSYKAKHNKMVDFGDFRRLLTFVFYILVSFFGTGNMATVSSFDPNWVRLLVSTFSPFLMTSLIVLKLLIPILVSVCILKSLHIITKVKAQTLFLLIFIICDLMCLHFFYLIKNKGSWLEIGSSISHFVIMECTTIVLTILYGCATLLTEFSFVKGDSNQQGYISYVLPYDSKNQ
ncbi:GPI ethanolamine phosphate transferase 1-like [Aedes albopictus]|uniref:GPI ethanolamine phosphate transferase 1 n=1 Tax=Aedes albopictus TaxID=7160 RepID=A0ABM1XMV4_AEDAL